MAYSCDGKGIYEARRTDTPGTTVYSRVIQSGGTPLTAPTTNVAGWSNRCEATQHFLSVDESGSGCKMSGGGSSGHS